MKAALQMLLDALAAPDKRVIQRSVYPEEVFNPERLQELIQQKLAERLPTGEIQTRAVSRYDPFQRTQAKALLDAAGSWGSNVPEGARGAPGASVTPENLKFVAKDPSAVNALMKLLVEGKQGEKARATLVALAAKKGMLPNHLFHGTNEHAVTGIAQSKRTAPQVSWEGGQGMAVQAPRTYWTPQPDVARGMAAETSKVGNVREELRHKALSGPYNSSNLHELKGIQRMVDHLTKGVFTDSSVFPHAESLGGGKYEISPLALKAAQTYANAMKRETTKLVEYAAARGEKISATHPFVLHAAAKRVAHTMSAVLNKTPNSEPEKQRFLSYASNIATDQYENLSFSGPKLSEGPSAWDKLLAPLKNLPPPPRVGDAGRPAVISTKLSKIAPKLDSDSLRELIRKLASGEQPGNIARNTYELTSKAIPASKLAARVVNPPNPELGESLGGLLFRSAKKMAPLEAVAEMLLKRRL